jgi:hypothetical protein
VGLQLYELGLPPVCTSGLAVHVAALKQRGETCTMRERLLGTVHLTKVSFGGFSRALCCMAMPYCLLNVGCSMTPQFATPSTQLHGSAVSRRTARFELSDYCV